MSEHQLCCWRFGSSSTKKIDSFIGWGHYAAAISMLACIFVVTVSSAFKPKRGLYLVIAIERVANLVRWTNMPRGGHFAALEAPDLLAADVATFFTEL